MTAELRTLPGMPLTGPAYGFGLYIHWPYCARICPYCDFNVYAAKDLDPEPLFEALIGDLHAHADFLQGALPASGLTSVFFGGGTPSLMNPAMMSALLGDAHARFGLAEGCEVTLEANPNDVLAADLADWRAAGIKRLSIGVQALDDAALAFLGRDHDAVAARRAVEQALNVFPSVSIDLIYARPGQALSDWQAELESALALGAHHLSLYELTIEARTAFGRRAARGDLVPMPEDAQAELYDLTQAITAAHGLDAYEISNHAASPEHRSVHNLTYWRGGDWIGVGPGAHGRLTVGGERLATEAYRRPQAYCDAVLGEDGPARPGWAECETLYGTDTARETLAMGLRPAEGVDLSRIEALAETKLDRAKLNAFAEAGWLRLEQGRLALTATGRLLADRVAAELAP